MENPGCFHTGREEWQLRKEYQRQRDFTKQDVVKLMPKFFAKRREAYNLRSRSKTHSTPKSKEDACVEYDLPFDESTIAPELRSGPVTKEETRGSELRGGGVHLSVVG